MHEREHGRGERRAGGEAATTSSTGARSRPSDAAWVSICATSGLAAEAVSTFGPPAPATNAP